MAFDIRRKKAFVCDLDGTLFMGPNPITPAVDFVIRNTKSGRFRYYYLTNGMKPSHVFGKPSPTLLAPVLAEFSPDGDRRRLVFGNKAR